MWLTVLGVTCGVLFITLCISLRYNYKFGTLIIDMEDACEEALIVLDSGYSMMSDLLQTPMASNSYEVRSLIDKIKIMRDSVLNVSNALVGPLGGIEEIEEIEEEKDGQG